MVCCRVSSEWQTAETLIRVIWVYTADPVQPFLRLLVRVIWVYTVKFAAQALLCTVAGQ